MLTYPFNDIIIPCEMTEQEKLEFRRDEARRLYHSVYKYYYLLNSRSNNKYESYPSYHADGMQYILSFIEHGHLYHYEVSQTGQEFYYFNEFDREAIPLGLQFYLDDVEEKKSHIILHPGDYRTGLGLILAVATIDNREVDWIYTVERFNIKPLELDPLIACFIKRSLTIRSIYENYQSWDFRAIKWKI